MSTKKQRRRERLEQERQRGEERRRNPVPLFLWSIAVVLLVAGAIGLAVRENREPPWPGAVWSEAHQHWH